MQLDQLVDGCQRAIDCRGIVMLSTRGDERRWCAFVVAVDGSVELRVGEPSRGWRRWRAAAGETWLRDHGFVHRIDAWSMAAIREASPRFCAELVASALREGLEVREGEELVDVLVHPGLLGRAVPPAPTAPHAAQVRHAIVALAQHGRGDIRIEGGRPASTWAWVFSTDDGGLVLSPEPADRTDDYSGDWTVRVDHPDLSSEAYKLTAVVHDEPGRSPTDPLFISFIHT